MVGLMSVVTHVLQENLSEKMRKKRCTLEHYYSEVSKKLKRKRK